MLRQRYLTALLAICLWLPLLPANAAVLVQINTPILLAKSSGMTLEQATAKVRRQTGGRILSADVSLRGGHKVFRIKVLLPSGHVRIVTIKANGR